MTGSELRLLLQQALQSDDFLTATQDLIESVSTNQPILEHVRVILQFMEDHGHVDFGAPGPLVHFVEKFYRSGYEEELLASISRRPVMHTAWMLNRVLNGTKNEGERKRFVAALQQASVHPQIDASAKDLIARFLRNSV